MKKVALLTVMLLFGMISIIFSDDRTITIKEASKAVSNRLEIAEESIDNYQVWVGIIPLSDYVGESDSPVRVFSDAEIKVSCSDTNKNEKLSTGVIMVNVTFKLLAATFCMDVNMSLDLLTNNAVAFYFENRATQTLKRVELEKYDSLLEQLTMEYYGQTGSSFQGRQYHTAIYCVIDGRRVDPPRRWFYAGNGTVEVHGVRAIGCVTEKTRDGRKEVWWPIHGKWYKEVPDWLRIPTIDYVMDGQTPFWEYIRNRQ